MPLSLAQTLSQKMILAFDGAEPSPDILATLQRQHIGGVTYFRSRNLHSPAQVRALSESLQRAARQSGQPPLLISVDQEGGTLHALPGCTQFPGNLALGATRSADLAYRAGHATATELAAMGITVNHAPVCDVNVNPRNPVVGPRSFGEDPALVADLAAAMIRGAQAAGVAATAKHFPGHGDTAIDSHHGLPVLPHDEDRLRRVELPPFAAAVQAGARLVMTGHIALPRFRDSGPAPATLSPTILRDLLRRELGFGGVIVTDALDMHAMQHGAGLCANAVAAARAGCDLLLLNVSPADREAVFDTLVQSAGQGALDPADLTGSCDRILRLKEWCSQTARPPLEVVNCPEYRALADEIAARSITLVRDSNRRLPLRLPADSRVAAIVPTPRDLTPADTSSYEKPALADALRLFHPRVDEIVIPIDPTEGDVAALRHKAHDYDLLIVGTINAPDHSGQAALVNALLGGPKPVIVAALRMPYDLSCFPHAPAYLCTYSLQAPSLRALARALWGQIPCAGHLPVTIPGLTHDG